MPGRGIQDSPLRIPQEWERYLPGFTIWFRDLYRDVLAKADIRNAIEGVGVTISGQSGEPATVAASQDLTDLIGQNFILATSSAFLANERLLYGEEDVLGTIDEGPGGRFIITVENGGIKGHKFRPAVALSVVGRPQPTNGFVSDIPADTNDTLLTRVADRLDFTQLTVGMAGDGLWTYAKIQDGTANSVLGRAAGTNGVLADIVSGGDGQLLIQRSGALQFDTLADGDIPAGIARDSEVATAISDHEAASDPHPGYLTPAEGDAAYQPISTALGLIFRGAGDPNGTVIAAIGALYQRSDGGAGTSLYVKESDPTGNTGWVAK